ncbi:selenoprotein F [Hermetia illucens]|uniref:selenoprotein F n=1 Tax=Hermetia illucens TaxID=343691 RepID=UPI0018CC133F|nr:selenoprotein F [Hermetia illucens]
MTHMGGSFGEFTAHDCRQLGFIKAQLLCSSCAKLPDFGLEDIKDHCLECCQEDSLPVEVKKYPKAVLEVCTCKFGAYPQIQAFIKSDRPSKFPNLQIKYVRGLDPTVKLLDKSGNVKETLSITKWNTDTVQEFFETHLENTKSEDDFLRTNEI